MQLTNLLEVNLTLRIQFNKIHHLYTTFLMIYSQLKSPPLPGHLANRKTFDVHSLWNNRLSRDMQNHWQNIHK